MPRNFWMVLCLCLPLLAAAAPASAQDITPAPPETRSTAGTATPPLLMLRQHEATHPERILLAFYKTAGIAPDFLTWGQKSPFLADANPMDHGAIVRREDERLRRALAEYDLEAPLVVHLDVYLNNYSTLQEKLSLAEFTPQTFFSYSLYDESVAIVPNGIAAFSILSITKEQMEEMLKKAGNSRVRAELLLKPVVADARTPFERNGKSYWLLLAEIGEIRLWSNGQEPQLLWMHRADWFTPAQDRELLDLKGGGL